MTCVPCPLLEACWKAELSDGDNHENTSDPWAVCRDSTCESLAEKSVRNLENRCPRKLNTPIVALTLSQDWQDSKGIAGWGQLMLPCRDNAAVILTCLQTLDILPSCPSPSNICQEHRKHELNILGIQKQVCNPQRA